MTGAYTELDPVRCKRYAVLMSHLNLHQAQALFAVLFVLVIVLMFISSLEHHKSNELTNQQRHLLPSSSKHAAHRARHYRLRKRYLGISSLCFVLAVTCTVMEVFVLFNIEYCDGEDLIQLYWGFWSVLQVGSCVAILGTMLQLCIVMGNMGNPSWAVALGTPVLVFAALGWLCREVGRQALRRVWRSEDKRRDERDDDDSDVEFCMGSSPLPELPSPGPGSLRRSRTR